MTATGSTPPPAPEREPQRARADGPDGRPQPGASSELDSRGEVAAPSTDVDGPTAIARRDLETVIRRAVDLSLAERDEEERLSEDEVVRVATELGLPARLARQALYERPALPATPSRFDRWFGDAILSSTRAVPLDADRLRRRIEDYLTTYEYLHVVRRRGGRVFLVPADDAISSLARGLFRPGSRHPLSRARRVVLDVRWLDENGSHVQVATDFGEQRKSAVRGAIIGGGVVAGAAGSIAAAVAYAAGPALPGAIPELTAFAGAFAGSMWGMLRLSGHRFRQFMQEAKLELDGLLDRAEHGDRLEPPPAPWRRRLEAKLRGR